MRWRVRRRCAANWGGEGRVEVKEGHRGSRWQAWVPSAVNSCADQRYKATAQIMPYLVPSQLRENEVAWERVFDKWDKLFLVVFTDADPITAAVWLRPTAPCHRSRYACCFRIPTQCQLYGEKRVSRLS